MKMFLSLVLLIDIGPKIILFFLSFFLYRHKGQRDYKCGVCDFFGYTFTDIRKHIERKHSDVKTLVCDKCGQTFRNETLLIVSNSLHN